MGYAPLTPKFVLMVGDRQVTILRRWKPACAHMPVTFKQVGHFPAWRGRATGTGVWAGALPAGLCGIDRWAEVRGAAARVKPSWVVWGATLQALGYCPNRQMMSLYRMLQRACGCAVKEGVPEPTIY